MTEFVAGEPVLRKDDPLNRYYVPISRLEEKEGVDSQTVLRVASDAFVTKDEAIEFGNTLVHLMNANAKKFKTSSITKYLITDQFGEFLHQDWYSFYKPKNLNEFEYTWSKLDKAVGFATLKEAEKLVKFYTDKKSRLNFKLHVCQIVKYEFTKKGSDIVNRNVVEVLPEKYETILDEWD